MSASEIATTTTATVTKVADDKDDSQVKTAKKSANHEMSTIVSYTDEELTSFTESLVAANTKKSTASSVRRFQCWYKEKYDKELNLNEISQKEAPYLLKHFFIEIRQTTKDNKGKEYEPGSLQTYRNGLRRYFLERPCPPAPDNFDIEKTPGTEFEEAATMLSMKKKDLKKKGHGNKPKAAKSLEEEDIEKMWSSGAIGLKNPRSLLHLVWWNNMTHLGMRAFQEQHDCQIDDFTVTEQYIEYTERQTKNRQGNEENARKRARKYNNKIWKTDGGEQDPFRAFIEYLEHRPKGDKVPNNLFLTPVGNPKSSIWYKVVPVGVNTLGKMMKIIASIASLDGKFTNSSGRKTVIQALREDFHPLEISELTGHANPESISSYSHNPLDKQRRMSHKLAGYSSNAVTSTTTAATVRSPDPLSRNVLAEVEPVSLAEPASASHRNNLTIPIHDPGYLSGAVSGLFTGVTFNHSPVNISINLQASVNRS